MSKRKDDDELPLYFSKEFIDYMDAGKRWLNNDSVTGKTQTYSHMKAGKTVPRAAFVSVIHQLLHPGKANESTAVAVEAFLAPHTPSLNRSSEIQEIMDVLCSNKQPFPRKGLIDPVIQGVHDYMDAFLRGEIKASNVQRCVNEKDIRECLEWDFVTGGQHLADDYGLDPELAKAAMSKALGLSFDDFYNRVVAWHAFNKWVLIRSRVKTKGKVYEAGMGLALPLKEDAYLSIRSGTKASFDCTTDDMTMPSATIYYEALAERPLQFDIPSGLNPSDQLAELALIQCGVLSAPLRQRNLRRLRILTVGATPRNEKRIIAAGFKPIGVAMLKTGWPLYEIEFGNWLNDPKLAATFLIMKMVGRSWKSEPTDHRPQ